MSQLINIEIVIPLKLILSKKTKMSILPAEEGNVGIMYKHTPIMTTLNRGIIKLYNENNSISDQIAIDGGVADVSEDGITVLSERAEFIDAKYNDKKSISEKINKLKNIIQSKKNTLDTSLNHEVEFLNYVMDNL